MTNLIVGAGKFGKRFYHYLQSLELSSITLSRSEKAWSKDHISVDLLDTNSQLPILPKLDYVFIILAPHERTEQAYGKTYIEAATYLLKALKQQQDSFHCVFLSATSVYGSEQLGEVNETVQPEPDNFRGKILLQAEKNIQALHDKISIVRASGLYSSERKRFLESLLDPGKINQSKFVNLIHEDDLCHWLYTAAKQQWPLSIASDGQPATRKMIQQSVTEVNHTNYRKFVSQYLKTLSLKHSSFINWLKSQ